MIEGSGGRKIRYLIRTVSFGAQRGYRGANKAEVNETPHLKPTKLVR